MSRSPRSTADEARIEERTEGMRLLQYDPLLGFIGSRLLIDFHGTASWRDASAWATVTEKGQIACHPTKRGTPEEWLWVFASCALHLAWEHHRAGGRNLDWWQVSCAASVTAFLGDLRVGTAPEGLAWRSVSRGRREVEYYAHIVRTGVVGRDLVGIGVGGAPGPLEWVDTSIQQANPHGEVAPPDLVETTNAWWRVSGKPPHWPALWRQGLESSVTRALIDLSGDEPTEKDPTNLQIAHAAAERARRWLMTQYPLLAALMGGFKLVTDIAICQRLDIGVAAVSPATREIFLNPVAGLDDDELIFVLAHELLHVALDHATRRENRDPFLWNVACDYVINGWLVEMQVGRAPSIGLLLDSSLARESAPGIYDTLTTDLRRSRRLRTMRGVGTSDILQPPEGFDPASGVGLEEFVRRALRSGMAQHNVMGRGTLPVGLVEELNALDHPPPAWDVELGRWFESVVPTTARVRTWHRLSRRAGSTPDIPRPKWVRPPGDGSTFAVLLDTSGSMDRAVLQAALGAISSYAIQRGVRQLRLIYADAVAYDAGWIRPESLLSDVQVKGRGGTVLQPSIDWLLQQPDLGDDVPLLVITDGWTDRLTIPREHAFLLPAGAKLPFPPQGPVFRLD